CTSALEQIASVGDDATVSRVIAALQRYEGDGKSGLAGVIHDLRYRQLEARRKRALAKIRALGGKVDGEEAGTSEEIGPAQGLSNLEIDSTAKQSVPIGALQVAARAGGKLPIGAFPDKVQPPVADVAAIAPPPDLPMEVNVAPVANPPPALAADV